MSAGAGVWERSLSTLRFLAENPVAHARTGQTPHTIIHRQNKASLRYFAPSDACGAHTPVFIVMPLINTWTIFDLLPGRSVVEALVQSGVPVYLLDWGRPGPEDACLGVADLIDDLLGRAWERALRHAKHQTMDVLGYCVGGTFLAVWLARNPGRARRAAFVATPIDFHKAGRIADWVKPERFPLDALVDSLGNYPGALIKGGFTTIKPMVEPGKYFSLWERADDEGFRVLWAALEHWNQDTVDFPGSAYRQYVRACYFENRLMTGGWELGGAPVDLRNATLPALVIAASKDPVVPAPAAYALDLVWGGPVTLQTIGGGHVSIAVSGALSGALLDWARSG